MTAQENDSNFLELSKRIASRFLQTVVVVDDQPIFDEEIAVSEQSSASVTPDKVIEPKKRGSSTNIESASLNKILSAPADKVVDSEDSETIRQPIPTDLSHELDIQSLVEVFSDKGLIFSVFRPRKNELDNAPSRVVKLARKADLLILDWVLFNSKGDTTIQIIKSIINSDQLTDGRLRTIIIYTGEADINQIAEKIGEAIEGVTILSNGECTIKKGNFVHISIFAKPYVNLPNHYSHRKISVQDLPDRLVTEFSQATSGLVSNVALYSLAILRENTHLLLSRLHSGIDIPFLTHRVLLPNPDDSSEHLVDLVAAEIRSILDEYEVKSQGDFEAVRMWLESKNVSVDYVLEECGLPENKLSKDQVLDLLKNGIKSSASLTPKQSGKMSKSAYKHLSKMFCLDIDKSRAIDLDHEFAMITSLARQHSSPSFNENNLVNLTLGTILQIDITYNSQDKDSSSSEENLDEEAIYWLCIQPRCDSVIRGDETKRFFPLLPLEIVTDMNKKFGLVIRDTQENYVFLKLHDRAYKVKMECFNMSSPSGLITAQLEDASCLSEINSGSNINKAFFFKTSDDKRYRWIADLKRDHAQRISNSFANTLSRVGLNESEWLRRSSL